MVIGVLAIAIGFGIYGNTIENSLDIKNIAASASMIIPQATKQEMEETENQELNFPTIQMEIAPAAMMKSAIERYDEMSIEQLEQALYAGSLPLEYSALYTNASTRLTQSKGALYFNGHRETYYSEKVLPGNGLNIPGRHAGEDGTIRDGDGYICVAADPAYMAKGSVLITSVGPAKVYDSGCAYGTIDIYVNW